jgi:putative DNA primase/helicase
MFVSIGNSRMDKKFNCTDMTYEDFVSRLSKTKHTAETMEQYRKMPKGQQDNIKDVGGFVLGKMKGGRRKKDCVISRSAITLDMDYGTQGIIDELEMFFDMKMVVYSTHKHTPEKPRLRIIIFLTRDVTPDEYGAVSRMLASDIGVELSMIPPMSLPDSCTGRALQVTGSMCFRRSMGQKWIRMKCWHVIRTGMMYPHGR